MWCCIWPWKAGGANGEMCALGGPGGRCDHPLARGTGPSSVSPSVCESTSSSRLGGGLGVATSSRNDRTCTPRAQPLPRSPSSVLRTGSHGRVRLEQGRHVITNSRTRGLSGARCESWPRPSQWPWTVCAWAAGPHPPPLRLPPAAAPFASYCLQVYFPRFRDALDRMRRRGVAGQGTRERRRRNPVSMSKKKKQEKTSVRGLQGERGAGELHRGRG